VAVRVAAPREPSADDRHEVGLPRGFWASFAAPGLLWLILFFLVPLYAVLSLAMGSLDPLFLTPVPQWNPLQWDPSAFGEVLADAELRAVMVRTFVYVGTAGALSLVIGYPVAYYISRHGGKTKTLLLVLLIAPFWISYLMRMLAWINLLGDEGYVNRILMFLGILSEPKSWLAGEAITVVLGLVYGYVPFLILPLFAALDRIDKSLLEAARDLGASPFKAFVRVTLPLSKQGILAGTVIILLPMFGDYYTPDLMSGAPRTTMFGNLISFYISGQTSGNQGAAMVLVLSAIVSVLMFYYLYSVAQATKRARA
jgi:ABC-type spermidine/putrescine transport system permease subunit I